MAVVEVAAGLQCSLRAFEEAERAPKKATSTHYSPGGNRDLSHHLLCGLVRADEQMATNLSTKSGYTVAQW